MKKVIPVFFSTDDNYAPYLGVCISSIIRTASEFNDYILYILATDLSDTHAYYLRKLSTNNVKVIIMDVSDLMAQWRFFKTGHLTKETSYRLLVDKIFYQYERILWIDCDMVVRKDVAFLFDIDMGDCCIAASRGEIPDGYKEYIENDLKIGVKDYFNAGVLLINIPVFKRLKIGDQALKMLGEKAYWAQDQDVLNILCLGKVFFLDGKWNVEWAHVFKKVYLGEGRSEKIKDDENPYIVHYPGVDKPWNHPEYKMAEYFWAEARKSSFYEEILYKNLNEKFWKQKQSGIWERFVFPWRMVMVNSRIVIYGGGVVGTTFCKQLEKTKYCQVIAICDKHPEKVKIEAPVITLQDLAVWKHGLYDAIIIAVERDTIAEEIRKSLIEAGIGEKKIIWMDYHRK